MQSWRWPMDYVFDRVNLSTFCPLLKAVEIDFRRFVYKCVIALLLPTDARWVLWISHCLWLGCRRRKHAVDWSFAFKLSQLAIFEFYPDNQIVVSAIRRGLACKGRKREKDWHGLWYNSLCSVAGRYDQFRRPFTWELSAHDEFKTAEFESIVISTHDMNAVAKNGNSGMLLSKNITNWFECTPDLGSFLFTWNFSIISCRVSSVVVEFQLGLFHMNNVKAYTVNQGDTQLILNSARTEISL